ncbi:DUF2147 domain-containing protein [Acinetobacter sp. ANC 3882]|uniref:DUF2147 domain-containing protein n=1 Tax=Acinetobacter sp. ANC 3882 TaxID=2923423 RepID=UPI001F4BA77E|nr:DUF2147 domain-containing protein [Acinetobacter sp. ANC 3882]MCH7315578.1 DUF2147 domain-containing protein [Acinetobacter sp. ANC 3882]
MFKKVLMKGIVCLTIMSTSLTTFAASVEGYWRVISDRTSEQSAIIEIKKAGDGTYRGKTVYIYPNLRGGTGSENCTNCPAPYTNKPRLGLEFMTNLIQDPKDPSTYVKGKFIDPTSGKIYSGKMRLSEDGKRLKVRGYIGVSVLGRSAVWIRTDSPTS